MNQTIHTDEVERMRVALWDCAAQSATDAEHAATCADCVSDIRLIRRMRDAWRRYAAADVPHRVVEAALVVTAGAVPTEWHAAVTVTPAGGLRAGTASSDVHVAWTSEDLRVEVLLHAAAGRGLAVTGQILGAGVVASAGVEVTLLVDSRSAAATTTDTFGEFAFDPVLGEAIGIRIGHGPRAQHIALWPVSGAR